MPWQPRTNVSKLQREYDRLTVTLARTRDELHAKERHVVGLKIALSIRLKRIDQLAAQVTQLQAQNRKLDDECEHLAEMIRPAPQPDTAISAPK
jgi:outer membrane murein-binding lipoprotein Lpp